MKKLVEIWRKEIFNGRVDSKTCINKKKMSEDSMSEDYYEVL